MDQQLRHSLQESLGSAGLGKRRAKMNPAESKQSLELIALRQHFLHDRLSSPKVNVISLSFILSLVSPIT